MLKTELPPALEHVAEQASTQDAFGGEILLEDEALPGHEGPTQDEGEADDRCGIALGRGPPVPCMLGAGNLEITRCVFHMCDKEAMLVWSAQSSNGKRGGGQGAQPLC